MKKKILLYTNTDAHRTAAELVEIGETHLNQILVRWPAEFDPLTSDQVNVLLSDPVRYIGLQLSKLPPFAGGLKLIPEAIFSLVNDPRLPDLVLLIRSVDRNGIQYALQAGEITKGKFKVIPAKLAEFLDTYNTYATTTDEVELYSILERLHAVTIDLERFGAHPDTLRRLTLRDIIIASDKLPSDHNGNYINREGFRKLVNK